MAQAAADYLAFVDAKSDLGDGYGFEPIALSDTLKPFQRSLVEWAIRRGRVAILASCGLGKTYMQLAWADNVVRHTNRPVLILTPLAVSSQTVREATKFGYEAEQSRDGRFKGKIVVTNYEQLSKFRPEDFTACVTDESGILKSFDGKTRSAIIEFGRTLPYRLLCSATPAPNDYDELGNSAEALGEMGYQDMITKFFRQETKKDHLGWGRTKYRIRGHAEQDFWRWICSWARACRMPSDLGFDDDGYILPPLQVHEHTVTARTRREGFLFDLPAISLPEQKDERRRTIRERCEQAAELVIHDRPAIAWCELNAEGDLLERLIPGAVQIAGSDSDEAKEEAFTAFAAGQIRCLVSKPTIAGWGLNWQHCAHQCHFITHSYEQWHQAVRRSYRFGQRSPVRVDVIASEGEAGIVANLRRKAEQAERMYDQLVRLMNDQLHLRRENPFTIPMEVPDWLTA